MSRRIPPSGRKARRLIAAENTLRLRVVSSPRVSPDGSRLAFISGPNEQTGQLWTISPTGGEATALTLGRTPTRFVRYPAPTNHGMSRNGPSDLRIHPLTEIVAWLREHLGS